MAEKIGSNFIHDDQFMPVADLNACFITVCFASLERRGLCGDTCITAHQDISIEVNSIYPTYN